MLWSSGVPRPLLDAGCRPPFPVIAPSSGYCDNARRPILNNSSPGQAVYEPFLGSGTTLIAAETVGRVCLALEIDPLFVDVAVRRWQSFTGKEATLLQTGETFAAREAACREVGKDIFPGRGTA